MWLSLPVAGDPDRDIQKEITSAGNGSHTRGGFFNPSLGMPAPSECSCVESERLLHCDPQGQCSQVGQLEQGLQGDSHMRFLGFGVQFY